MTKEEAILLGPHRSLVGVYTSAAAHGLVQQGARPAVVLFNAGLVHHVGPHRLYVDLARALAARGVAVLRVDFSGIGDSAPRPDHLPAEELAVREPKEILEELSRRGHDAFILCGICSGAKHALLAVRDDRVKGLILINQAATTRDEQVDAHLSAQYYLRRSLWSPRAWRNLLTGKVDYLALFGTMIAAARRMLQGGRGAPKPTLLKMFLRELDPALAKAIPVLVVFSDRHADFMKLLGEDARQLQRYSGLRMEMHPAVDHLFTSLDAKAVLIRQVCQWVETQAERLSVDEPAAMRA